MNLLKNNSNIWGLKWIPSIPERDDKDAFPETHIGKNIQIEFSPSNQEYLKEKFLSIKNRCKCIVEIGVHRNVYNNTSTSILLDNKHKETVYIGIDVEDKSFLNDKDNNIYTIKTDSRNRNEVYNLMKEVGVEEIDFLFIDGWHSINMVVNDWQYTEKLSNFGIVGFHDTNFHPGPYHVFEAVDENLFHKEKFLDGLTTDWGISFVTKK